MKQKEYHQPRVRILDSLSFNNLICTSLTISNEPTDRMDSKSSFIYFNEDVDDEVTSD